MSLLELFCDVDDFLLSGCRRTGKPADCERARNERVRVSSAQSASDANSDPFSPVALSNLEARITPSMSEYTEPANFLNGSSYQRFVALIPGVMVPILAYLQSWANSMT
ncbi:MAG TPA: hypothetical protein VGM01_09780 [Ktedonobacteraceae bacterium]|jgi:hypothetical protein